MDNNLLMFKNVFLAWEKRCIAIIKTQNNGQSFVVNGHYLNSICSGVGFFLSVTNKTEDKGPRAQVFVTARAKWTDDHYAYTSDTVPDN